MNRPDRRELWDRAPCGLLRLTPDATVADANATFLSWVGMARDEVVGRVRLPELLSVGGRIYWETHLTPLLRVDGRADEVALELRTPYGRRAVVLTAVVDPPTGAVDVTLAGAALRAGFERELRAARAGAERSAAQVRQLQGTTAALSQALGVAAVADALVAQALGPLGAASATLWLAAADGALAVRAAGGDGAVAQLPSSLLLGDGAVQQPQGVVVPLHGQTALQGVLVLTARPDAGAEPLDLEVLTAVGQQAGLALDRAQRHEHSADVARVLQHSLLAVAPPVDLRFAVATAYRPGVELLEVGGDWYDVFLSGEGRLCVVVGDVVGRGLGAASAMGQLRSAVRAIAGPDTGPARLLSRLDRFVDQVEPARMATLVLAQLDLATGVATYACAGHPPPLLLPAEGGARLLWDGRSTPLGAYGAPPRRRQAAVRLASGDRLLLCTDGLFERRGRPLDEGLDLLVATAEGVGHLPLPDAVRTLTDTLLADEVVRDDACLLLLSWAGPAGSAHSPRTGRPAALTPGAAL